MEGLSFFLSLFIYQTHTGAVEGWKSEERQEGESWSEWEGVRDFVLERLWKHLKDKERDRN